MKATMKCIALCSLIFIYSCNKSGSGSNTNQNSDALSLADEEILENTPLDTLISDSTIILPNGISAKDYLLQYDTSFYNSLRRTSNASVFNNLGPETSKNLIISYMTTKAWWLANRKFHQYPSEGANKPAQNGLAYLWGAKEYTTRAQASSGSNCTDELYGLDCSGLVNQLFMAAQITTLPVGPAESQRQVNTIQNAIISSIPSLSKKILVQDLGQIPATNWQTGDIIYWLNGNNVAEHIGIILLNPAGAISIVQSNGLEANNTTDCNNNNNGRRGPNILKPQNVNWFDNGNYRIVRINANISGNWNMHLRCTSQPSDFALLNLSFPTDSLDNFTLNTSYLDYNGTTTGNVALNFTYNNVSNLLSCNYTTTFNNGSSPRTDQFSVNLITDSIPYFPVSVVVSNGACIEQVSLVNSN